MRKEIQWIYLQTCNSSLCLRHQVSTQKPAFRILLKLYRPFFPSFLAGVFLHHRADSRIPTASGDVGVGGRRQGKVEPSRLRLAAAPACHVSEALQTSVAVAVRAPGSRGRRASLPRLPRRQPDFLERAVDPGVLQGLDPGDAGK